MRDEGKEREIEIFIDWEKERTEKEGGIYWNIQHKRTNERCTTEKPFILISVTVSILTDIPIIISICKINWIGQMQWLIVSIF